MKTTSDTHRDQEALLNAKYLYENAHRPIVIAGNGPSLAEIDGRRMPENPMIMRINNFFFEEKYFLGRRADIVYVAGPKRIIEKYINTLLYVVDSDQYNIGVYIGRASRISSVTNKYFPLVDANNYFKNNCNIKKFMEKVDIHPNYDPTSGILSIFSAISFGFKDIYLTGIDFYSGEKMYSFKIGENHSNIVGITPEDIGYTKTFHNKDLDIEALLLAKKITGVSIRSLSPSSPIENFIPAADVIRGEPVRFEKKPDGYTKDFITVESLTDKQLIDNSSSLKIYNIITYIHNLIILYRTELFDPKWYFIEYPEVLNAGWNARSHFLLHGCVEGKNPSPKFNTIDYYRRNPDVINNGMNALVHYIRYGRKEGRLLN